MALKIKRTSPYKARILSTLVMIFALMVQPLVALNVPAVFATPVSGQVYINEIMPDPTSGSEWVEISYSGTSAQQLKDWYIKDAANNRTNFLNGDVLNNGNRFFVLNTTDLNNSGGDTVTLFDSNDNQVDSITYPSTVGTDESYGRSPDGDTNLVTFAASNVTKGLPNYVDSAIEPTLSFVANYMDASANATSSWRGISVEINTPNMTDAKNITVSVARSNGEPDVWVSNPANTNATGGLNGASHGTTAPIVIVEGTRTRTTSSSWLTSSAPWTNNQTPQNVTVTVERENGNTLTGTMSIGSIWGTTWTDIVSYLSAPAAVCNSSTFDSGFTLGSVNGQNGWSATGPYDQAIVANTYGYTDFGCKSLRLSDADTSGSFGDWVFAPSASDTAGESSVADVNHYEVEFSIASTMPTAEQPGLKVSVSPDDGNGSRMSYLAFADQADGIHVLFDDVTNTGPLPTVTTWNEVDIATLDRSSPHAIKMTMDFVDGSGNDVVKVYVDGVLKHTGTSWEDYYRFDSEQAGNGNALPSIDTLIMQARGTEHPANAGNGFLFDNVQVATSMVTPDTTKPSISNIKVTVNDDKTYNSSQNIIVKSGDSVKVSADLDGTGSALTKATLKSYERGHYSTMLLSETDMNGSGNGTYDLTFTVPDDYSNGSDIDEGVDQNAFNINTKDEAGNIRGVQFFFTVDNTKPKIQNIKMYANGHELTRHSNTIGGAIKSGDTIKITADISDAGSSVDSATIYAFKTGVWSKHLFDRVDMTNDGSGHYSYEFELPAAYLDSDIVSEVLSGNAFIITAKDGVGNAYGPQIKFTVDNTAPPKPTGLKRVHSESGDVIACGAVSKIRSLDPAWDAYGGADLDHYNYKTRKGHTDSFTTNYFETNGWMPSVDGSNGFMVQTVDKAGNASEWSGWCDITFDSTAPDKVTGLSAYNSEGEITSGVTMLENVTLKWNAVSGAEKYEYCYFNDIATSVYREANCYQAFPTTNQQSGAFNQGEGMHYMKVRAIDAAGNEGEWSDTLSIFYLEHDAVVNGENFNTHSGDDYKGLNIGFNIANFGEVTGVKVELFDGDTLMVTNTHNQDLLDLIAGGTHQLSTPFITIPGTYTEQYWHLGSYDWTNDSPRPTRAVVTVDGKNNAGQAVTKTAELINLSEPNGWTFTGILPEAESVVNEAVRSFVPRTFRPSFLANTPTQPFSQGNFPVNPPAGDGQNEETTAPEEDEANESAILGEQDKESGTPLEDTDVLGAMDSKFLGLAWYWWLVILAALVGGWLLLAAAIRKGRESEA